MKKITLKISEDLYKDLNNSIFDKKLSCSYGGLIDGVLNKILSSIKDNKKEIILEYKTK